MKNFTFKILGIIFAITLCLGIFTACFGEQTPQHTHDYKTLKTDEDNHWYECECGAKDGMESHKGGTATCKELAICEVCLKEYGELDYHEYNILNSNTESHWYECSCGDKYDVEFHKGGTATCTELAICEVCSKEYGKLPIITIPRRDSNVNL